MDNYIEFKNVCKEYLYDGGVIKALNNVNFSIKEGEFVILLGASGAGKSTALNILGGMDYATSGEVIVNNKTITSLNEDNLTLYRRNDIGFVFQFYNLIQNLNVLENVQIASKICSNPMDPIEILESVGLQGRLNNFPSQISGGEQQRVSIARAIAKNPKILLCDEPTGALDYNTGKQILKLLQTINKKYHMTVIVITHNTAFKTIGNRVITFKSGEVISTEENSNPESAEVLEW